MGFKNTSRHIGAMSAGVLLAVTSLSSFAVPVVTVGGASSGYSVKVGDTITISVVATVTDPVSTAPPSGIFTFDFDALVINPASLQVVSCLPDGDPTLGNATFTSIDSAGAHNINAGFDTNGFGVGAATEVFTLKLKGIAAGTNGINIGDSVVPQGAPIVLFDDSEPKVNTSPIGVQVLPAAVPEPATLSTLALASVGLLVRGRGIRSCRN